MSGSFENTTVRLPISPRSTAPWGNSIIRNKDKTLIVMGYIGSERDGMRLLTERLQQWHNDLEIRYFECGEVYRNLS